MHSSVKIRNSVRDNTENGSNRSIAVSSVNKDSLTHLPRGSLRSFDKTKLRRSTGRCGEGRLSPLTFPERVTWCHTNDRLHPQALAQYSHTHLIFHQSPLYKSAHPDDARGSALCPPVPPISTKT